MSKKSRKANKAKRQAKKATRQAKRKVKKTARTARKDERKENRQARKEVRQDNQKQRKEQRKANRQGKNFLGRAVYSIGGGIKGAVQNSTEYLRDTGIGFGETRLGSAIDNFIEEKIIMFVKLWPSNSQGIVTYFPESQLPEIMKRPNIGICFSGGGSRSAVASFGIMRALVELKYEDKLRYTSSLSGGSWFAIPYTFLPKTISDKSFFGKYIPLKDIKTVSQLRSNTRESVFGLGVARGQIWLKSLVGSLVDGSSIVNKAKDENWSRAVGTTYLKLLGLYDAERVIGEHRFFTWSKATRDSIINNNKALESHDFHIVEKSRPFNITTGALSGEGAIPDNVNKRKELRYMSLLEMTPLYSGVSTPNNSFLNKDTALGKEGGGYIESFGMDSKFKGWSGKQSAKIKLRKRYRRFTLSDVIGISGSALGALDNIADKAFTPDLEYWPVTPNKPAVTKNYNALDGGYLDNHAIMPLLKRKVSKIIVCVNSGTGISRTRKIAPSTAHLFGVTNEAKTPIVNRVSKHKNYVFSNSNGELKHLLEMLLDNNLKSGVSYWRDTYSVIDNSNYGITPYKVDILWYYLDKSEDWTLKVNTLGLRKSPSTLHFIKDGLENKIRKALHLPLSNHQEHEDHSFPNYSTVKLGLAEEEVSLLSNYTHWCFLEMEDTLKDFFS